MTHHHCGLVAEGTLAQGRADLRTRHALFDELLEELIVPGPPSTFTHCPSLVGLRVVVGNVDDKASCHGDKLEPRHAQVLDELDLVLSIAHEPLVESRGVGLDPIAEQRAMGGWVW